MTKVQDDVQLQLKNFDEVYFQTYVYHLLVTIINYSRLNAIVYTGIKHLDVLFTVQQPWNILKPLTGACFLSAS